MLRVLANIVALMLILGPALNPARTVRRARSSSKGQPSDVINFVMDAFWNARVPGSLITGGNCYAPDAPSDAVSDALPNPPAGPFHSIAAALTALAKADPRVSWGRGPNGVIRVWDGKVSEGLLHLHLNRVHLRDHAQAGFAIGDILSTTEVQAYLKENHIKKGLYVRVGDLGIFPTTTKGLPRLSATLRNVTVEQALDLVAEFYHRVWIYSYCQSGPRRVVVITVQ